jgi:hypothetical protein
MDGAVFMSQENLPAIGVPGKTAIGEPVVNRAALYVAFFLL